MSFFEKIYRREFSHSETIGTNLPELSFRYTDVLGGLVMGYSTQADDKVAPGHRRQLVTDAVQTGLYYLVANGYLTIRRDHYKSTLLDSLDFKGDDLVLIRNTALPGLDELESPLLTAIYSAADGKRSPGRVIRKILDGYLGPLTKHDRPFTVFYSALLTGEMRFWRLERETSNWGFTEYYQFACPDDHRGILTEAGRTARDIMARLPVAHPELFGVLKGFTRTFLNKVAGRRRASNHHHHHPRHPHRKPPRRRKRRPQEPDDPRMWVG